MGCNEHIAEDLTQSMYLKVDAYIKKHNPDIMYNETELNYYFFWITLKNMYMDYHRKRVNNPIIYVEEVSRYTRRGIRIRRRRLRNARGDNGLVRRSGL
jgi:hypothetical protein